VLQDKELQNEIHVERVHVEYTGINVDEGNITMLASLFFYFIYFFNLAKFNVKIGLSNKRTRGSTRCLQIHARNTEDLVVILDKDGEHVSPNIRVVSNLSHCLGKKILAEFVVMEGL